MNPDEPPSAVTALVIDQVTTESITIAWEAASDDDLVEGYRVYRNDNLLGTVTELSFEESGLLQDTEYTYAVVAVDSSGQEGTSTSVSAKTLSKEAEDTPPTSVSDFQITDTTSSSISLAWSPASDDQGEVTYQIYRNGLLALTTSQLAFQDTGLQPDTFYTYAIVAVDSTGQSSDNVEITGRTDVELSGCGTDR